MQLVLAVALRLLACLTFVAALDEDSVLAKGLEADDACAADGAAERCDLTMLQLRKDAKAQLAAGGGDAGEAGRSAASDAAELDENRTGVVMTLFHQTSPSAGHSILAHGFNRGSARSLCGAAIYFSPTAKDTNIKVPEWGNRGFMIEARVNLGRIKTMSPYCDHSMNYHKLKAEGYNSMTLDRGGIMECAHVASCREYIIYDRHQIISMKGYPYHGTAHWWSPNAAMNAPMAADGAVDDNSVNDTFVRNRGLDANAIVDDCR